MTERPILFSGEMVRAILQGRKTQTRRVVSDRTSCGNYRASELLLDDPRTFADPGPSPAGNPGWYLHAYVNAPLIEQNRGWNAGDCDPSVMDRLYPWVFRGDRLWVRERWGYRGSSYTLGEDIETQSIEYADGEYRSIERPHRNRDGIPVQPPHPAPTGDECWDTEMRHEQLRKWWASWRPSIHMPRWASRITLEVTEVRVERLQDISKADCIAEGMVGLDDVHAGWHQSYATLWDTLNKSRGYSWESNPYVWVVCFRRATTTEGNTP